MRILRHLPLPLIVAAMLAWDGPAAADDLREVIRGIKPSVVGIGTHLATRRPEHLLLGTGFAVGDGRRIVTNAHAVSVKRKPKERLMIFSGHGQRVARLAATVLCVDQLHDTAVVGIGKTLPALPLGDDETVEEGLAIAFTGFPIGAVLGLYPATHRGIVSALTPIAAPAVTPGALTAKTIQRLRNNYEVFQLDATAYPGNSGNPLYEQATGRVVGIVSSVFVKESKEAAITDPSGISYAIPIRYARRLLDRPECNRG